MQGQLKFRMRVLHIGLGPYLNLTSFLRLVFRAEANEVFENQR